MRALLAIVLVAGLLIACSAGDQEQNTSGDASAELEGVDEIDQALAELEDLDSELSLEEDLEGLNLTTE